MNPEERAREVRAATSSDWSRRAGGHTLDKVRGNQRLVVVKEPDFIYDKENNVVGVDAWVQLFAPNGRELPIDPHRRIINPPTVPRSGVVDEETTERDRRGQPVMRRILTPDPTAAFYEAVWDSVLGTPNEKGWRTRGTVTTVFSGTNDGDLESTSETDYSTARAGTEGISANTSATTMVVGQALFVDDPFFLFLCDEAFVSFDTSPIADSDVVSAVVLDLYLSSDFSDTDFTIEARSRDWGATLTTEDFVAGASLSSQTLLASISTSGIGSTGSYKTLTSQAAFLTAPNIKTGTVYVMLCSSRMTNNNAPSGNEYVSLSSANASGTTQDPKLTITHAAAGGGPPFFASRPNRIWRLR